MLLLNLVVSVKIVLVKNIILGGLVMGYAKGRKKGRHLKIFPKDYTVVDIETTGRDCTHDYMIEVAAIKVRDNEIVDTFSELIKPKVYFVMDKVGDKDDVVEFNGEKIVYIPNFISELTGITNADLHQARTEKEVMIDFLKFIGDDILVGHNIVSFDSTFLYDSIQSNLGEILNNDLVDTLYLAKDILNGIKNYQLDTIIDYCKITKGVRHRALADSEVTLKLLQKLEEIVSTSNLTLEDYIKEKKMQISPFLNLPLSEYFENLNVCITGTLEIGKRDSVEKYIEDCGGIPQKSVTKKTDILILGDYSNRPNVREDLLTKKLRDALRYIREGKSIEILSEEAFLQQIIP